MLPKVVPLAETVRLRLPSRVIVPLLAMYVPLISIVPATYKAAVPEAVNVSPLPIINVPLTSVTGLLFYYFAFIA